MFRHKGKGRTFHHNRRLAAILSLTAGIVNIIGVLSIQTLTTNVTGHFAFFAEEIVNDRYLNSLIFLVYILAFLFGAFISNLLIELNSKKNPLIAHSFPMGIEIFILTLIGLYGYSWLSYGWNPHFIAYSLLFAMGMQNALVTTISSSTVRTTHLTGLFTDLGIELSQLFFYRQEDERTKLIKSIRLRMVIIVFFFSGCIIGGFAFGILNMQALLIASVCLIMALIYDNIRYRFYYLKRKLR
ncbi:YoaK family protein [Daejeonella sp. H1SJ63]|jgi:uncharacterized membrane protein YoaK (UPF0700 family)|uniref:YoaK family protein n=1 Tax=Daejeonella sp. H1SJ63 TaxID=3034145 RepID=UPI0023EBD2E9|nr:YoaK family protein [Daejeonella sp. H1SJ63]